jgi:hypothetical protein
MMQSLSLEVLPSNITLKRCSKCGQEKSLDSFQANRKQKDGRQNQCKPCRKRAGDNDQHQESLDLGRELLALALKHPGYADILNEAIGSVRNRGTRTVDRDLEAITQAFKAYSCLTLEDLCEETKLPEHDVEAILAGMLTTRMIDERRRQRPDISRGAFEMVYCWTEQKSPSSMVLP